MEIKLNNCVKLTFLTLSFVLFNLISVFSQPFAIGDLDITWNDPDRANRAVELKVYYPASTAGSNTAPAAGTFPSVVFGHGFAMSYTSYENLWEYFVPKGYIFVMVDMENGLSPSHESFGRDILFAGKTFKDKSALDAAFLLHQKHNGKTAFAGHSMGGGATVLAASYDANFPDAAIGLAPAETNPSAIAAAASVTAPYVVFSGSTDAVTPPAEHHQPIYDALDSECKTFVSITGGAHCYFANTNVACDFGETVSGNNATISRNEQQTFANSIMEPFFAVYLKSDVSQQAAYLTAIAQSGVVSERDCSSNVGISESGKSTARIYPNPSAGEVIFENIPTDAKFAKVISVTGTCYILPINESKIQLKELPSGIYNVEVSNQIFRVLLIK